MHDDPPFTGRDRDIIGGDNVVTVVHGYRCGFDFGVVTGYYMYHGRRSAAVITIIIGDNIAIPSIERCVTAGCGQHLGVTAGAQVCADIQLYGDFLGTPVFNHLQVAGKAVICRHKNFAPDGNSVQSGIVIGTDQQFQTVFFGHCSCKGTEAVGSHYEIQTIGIGIVGAMIDPAICLNIPEETIAIGKVGWQSGERRQGKVSGQGFFGIDHDYGCQRSIGCWIKSCQTVGSYRNIGEQVPAAGVSPGFPPEVVTFRFPQLHQSINDRVAVRAGNYSGDIALRRHGDIQRGGLAFNYGACGHCLAVVTLAVGH